MLTCLMIFDSDAIHPVGECIEESSNCNIRIGGRLLNLEGRSEEQSKNDQEKSQRTNHLFTDDSLHHHKEIGTYHLVESSVGPTRIRSSSSHEIVEASTRNLVHHFPDSRPWLERIAVLNFRDLSEDVDGILLLLQSSLQSVVCNGYQ